MTWVATGVGVAGAVTSASSASKAGKSASRNAATQQQLLQRDLDERQRVARRQEGLYGGLEERLVSNANRVGIDPIRAGIIRSTVGNEYNTADRNITTMIGNRGVSSGLAASILGGSQMNRARTMAGGILSEYQNKDALGAQLLQRYNPLQNAEFQSSGLRNMAGFYGDEAQRARAAEQQGWSNAAQGAMGAAMMYTMNRPKSEPSAPPTPAPGLPEGQPVNLPEAPGAIQSSPQTSGFADAYSNYASRNPRGVAQPFGTSRLPMFSTGGWGVMPASYSLGRQ